MFVYERKKDIRHFPLLYMWPNPIFMQ